jgi:hypothetical protein
MNVSMWMSRELVTIGPHTPITEAAALAAHKNIRHLPFAVVHARTWLYAKLADVDQE